MPNQNKSQNTQLSPPWYLSGWLISLLVGLAALFVVLIFILRGICGASWYLRPLGLSNTCGQKSTIDGSRLTNGSVTRIKLADGAIAFNTLSTELQAFVNHAQYITDIAPITVANDTNIRGSIASNVLTLSWNGQLSDARLSSNVALLNANQTFSGNNSFSAPVQLLSSLTVGGATNLSSSLGVGGAVTVTGATNLNSTLTVAGATTINNNLIVTGSIDINGLSYVWPGTQSNGVLANDGLGNLAWQPTGACATCITNGGNAFGSAISIGSNDANSLTFETSGTDRLTITAAGQVGIGTSPGYALDVAGDINSSTGLRVASTLVCTISGCTAASGSGSYIQNGTVLQTTANFNIQSAGAGSIGGIIRGAVGQTANLQEWQNSGGVALSGINASGNLFLGKASTTTGLAILYNSGGSGSITLAGANPGASAYNITFPAETGTVCTTGSVCSGYAGSSGSGSYIQNGTVLQTTANFNIQSAGAGSIGGIIRGAVGQTANLQEWQNSAGTVLGSIASNGDGSFGANPAATGAIRIPNNTYIKSRNAANTADLIMLYLDTLNNTHIDSGAATVIYAASTYVIGVYSNRIDARKPILVGSTSGSFGTVTNLKVGDYTTVDNLANVMLSASATTAKPLVIQGVASQTANLQEWQNSGGTSLAAVDASGRFVATTLGGADTTTALCRNSNNKIATCSGTATGAAFVQGGNSFGATAILGTNDANALTFITSGTEKARITTGGDLQFSKETAHTIKVNDTTTADTAGAALSVTAGAGFGTATGGGLSLTGGASGATSGVGGAVNITGGASTGVTAGGAVNITGGGGVTGGSITLNPGTNVGGLGTVNIANTRGHVVIGNGAGASSVTINSGTGAIAIGTNAIDHVITIGNATGATDVNVNLGSGVFNVTNTAADANNVAQFNNAGATACTVQPGGTGFACSSDARLKTNILTLGDSTDIVNKLRGVSFNWISSPNGQSQSGFLAQELMQVIPGAVSQDASGHYVANYSAVVPYLVNAFQDSDKRLTAVEAKINSQQLAQAVFDGGVVTGDTEFKGQATFDALASFKGQAVFAGGATFEGVTRVKGRLQLGSNNTGSATIAKGSTTVHVTLPSGFSAIPNVNLTPQNFVNGQYRVTNVTTTSFDIETSAAQTNDTGFYWQVF
ncbi:tail fiber domain-containing protein [Candidatus Saccharibacteria bacterium]|nr:tail fiber domain-containing protein [Candidatus Saccharibacteria bacterium]